MGLTSIEKSLDLFNKMLKATFLLGDTMRYN